MISYVSIHLSVVSGNLIEPNVGQSSAAMDDVDDEQEQSRDAADVSRCQ